MPLPDNGDHRVLVERLHLQRARGVGRCAVQDADVDALVAEGVDLLARIHLEEREPDVRLVHPEEAEHVGEDARPGRGLDEADAEPPRLAARGALRGAHATLGLREREPRLGEKGVAGGRELDAACMAFEERRADLALQVADLPAQRRLRDVESPRRAAEVQLLGDRDEVAKVAELHARRRRWTRCGRARRRGCRASRAA